MARRRCSWRSRNSGGVIRVRIDSPIASSALHPNISSAARFQPRMIAVAVEGDERVRRAVEHEPGASLALAQLAAALVGLGVSRAQAVEHARDQQPGHQRSADPQQPADRGAGRRPAGEHDRVAHADVRRLDERHPRAEEVEGVQPGPGVQQGVQSRSAGVVVREPEQRGTDRERHLDVRLLHAIGVAVERGGDQGGDPDDHPNLRLAELRVVRQDQRQSGERRTRGEQVRERSRLDPQVE